MSERSHCSTSSPAFGGVRVQISAIGIGVLWNLTVVLVCIAPMRSDVEVSLYACLPFLGEVSVEVLSPFFNGIVFVFNP